MTKRKRAASPAASSSATDRTLVRRIIDSIRSLLRRTPGADEQATPRFVVAAPARLLAGITDGAAAQSAGTGRKLIGSTHNISAGAIAVLVTSLDMGSHLIAEGSALRVALDLHPLGTVEMDGLMVGVEAARKAGRATSSA